MGEEDDEDMVEYEEGDEDEEDPDLEIIDHDKENSNGHGEMQQNKDGQVSTPKKVESPIRNKRLNFSKVLYFFCFSLQLVEDLINISMILFSNHGRLL